MIRKLRWLVGLATGSLAGGTSLAWNWSSDDKGSEGERKITLEQAPSWVKATILKAAGKSKIAEIEEVSRGGDKFYEAAWIKDGKEIEVKVAPDGAHFWAKKWERGKARKNKRKKRRRKRRARAKSSVR